MTNYLTLCDDMNQLKAQMNILMSHLRQNEIITDEMIHNSVQNRMKSIVPSRIAEYAALAMLVFLSIFFIYCYCIGKMTSLAYVIATIAMCIYSAFQIIYGKYNNLRNICKNGTLTEVATQVARMRRQNALFSITTPLVLIAVCSVYFYEYYNTLITEHNGLFMVMLIILFVTSNLIYRFYRVHHITGEVLDEIENFKKEK